MEMNDLILVSVDDHLLEPADLFSRHMSEANRSRAPRLSAANGKHVWHFEGKAYPTIGLNAVVGRPKNEYGVEPASYTDMRKGCWDVRARIDDMNANGVLGSLCFPSFLGYAGGTFLNVSDRQLALDALRAYNDWHIHDWAGAAPGRFIPLAMLPLWDIGATVAEVKRVNALGVHAISFPDNPTMTRLPSIHTDYWDPLWKACADLGVIICCHIGTGVKAPHASAETPIDAWIITMPIAIANSAADWLHARMFSKYPSLKMMLSEGGIGWIPYFMERADYTHQQHGAWTHADFGGLKPSEHFRKHIITCFVDDQFGARNLDAVGEDLVMWECDYPHADTSWPESPDVLWKSIRHLPPSTIDKVTHLNAMRELHYDPFSVLEREQCTVGALRSQASHIDVSPVEGMGGINPSAGHSRPVTSGDFQRLMNLQIT